MAALERGTKRQCLFCGTKFYDLNRDPITCPSCGKPFQLDMVRQAARHVAPVKEEEEAEVEDVVEAGPEIVSLEEAEESEDDIPDVEDIEDVDTDGDDDDVFLETDEDEDDVDFGVDGIDDEE